MNHQELQALKDELKQEVRAEFEQAAAVRRKLRARLVRGAGLLALGIGGLTIAATVIPNTFTANTPISASQVNANFTALNSGKQDKLAGDCSTTPFGSNGGVSTRAVTGVNADGTLKCLPIVDSRFGAQSQNTLLPSVGPLDLSTLSAPLPSTTARSQAIGTQGITTQGISDDCTIGEVLLFAGNFAPVNSLFAQGQLLAIQQYTPLYAVIGTTYGGNGTTNFALPDMRGLQPRGVNYVFCVNGIFPSRP